MRGSQVYTILPPSAGLRVDVPPQMAPPGSLIAGQNCFLDIDGLFKARFGYGPWQSGAPTQSILGLLWYTDTNGAAQYVAGGATALFALISGTWTQISSGALHGDATDLVRIIDYDQPYVGSYLSALFANNYDPIQIWNAGLANSQNLTPIYAAAGTSAYTFNAVPAITSYVLNQQFFFTVANANTAPSTTISAISVASDKVTVTATVASTTGFFVGQGIVIAGTSPACYVGNYIISAIGTGTITWVLPSALAACPYVSGGTITGGTTVNINGAGIVPVRYVDNGVVTELPANYLTPGNTYNIAYDGTEMLIGTNIPAPTARDIFVLNERVIALNIIDSDGVRHPPRVAWSSAFDGQTWPPLAYQDLVDTDDPLIAGRSIGANAGVIYGEESAWLVQGVYGATDANAFYFTQIPAVIVGPVSPQAIVSLGGVHYFLARDGRIWFCDGASAQPLSGPIDAALIPDVSMSAKTTAFAFYHAPQKQVWFVYQSVSAATHAVVMALRNNQPVFEPLQSFGAALTAGAPIVDSATGVPTVLLAASGGAIYRFDSGFTSDNGAVIAYSFTPTLLNAGPATDILLDSLEMWFAPATASEVIAVELDALRFPLDSTFEILESYLFNVNNPGAFFVPKASPTLNTYSRYIRLTISGSSAARLMKFAGAQLFYNPQARASS